MGGCGISIHLGEASNQLLLGLLPPYSFPVTPHGTFFCSFVWYQTGTCWRELFIHGSCMT